MSTVLSPNLNNYFRVVMLNREPYRGGEEAFPISNISNIDGGKFNGSASETLQSCSLLEGIIFESEQRK